MIRYATTPPKIQTTATRPLYDPTVITRVAPDLRAVIEKLQAEHTHARGVALPEQLITDGGSPLYGENEARLREELHRVRAVLDECVEGGLHHHHEAPWRSPAESRPL